MEERKEIDWGEVEEWLKDIVRLGGVVVPVDREEDTRKYHKPKEDGSEYYSSR